jgi:hypothetical protein
MRTPHTATAPLLRLSIVLLTLCTGITHLLLNFPDPIFIGNGVGYILLLAALYGLIPPLAPYAPTTRWLLIGYTVLTIVLWIFFGARSTIGYINKTNEIVLIVLLVLDARRAHR